ncbi:hypothetical protein JCM10207_003109 [Rhodosporidiobolus poonsookiae]
MSSTPTPAKSSRQSTKSSRTPNESVLLLPQHAELKGLSEGEQVELVDTHTHVLSTFLAYKEKYPEGQHQSVKDFVKATLPNMDAVVDVWCEAPMKADWSDVVESLVQLKEEDASAPAYHFVVGAHPHEAKDYTDELEKTFLEAHAHPACVGWGEIGLDYYYDNSPREIQQDVLRRQIRAALKSGQKKAITIHTRTADDDIQRILKEELPKEQRLHIHCFTDTPECAASLLDHFPNCFIGVTGVVSFSSNLNTAQVVRNLGAGCSPEKPEGLRIVLETDAPFMVPTNLPTKEMGMNSKQRFPFSTPPVLPWTAEFVARVLNEGKGDDERKWTTVDVLRQARENARKLYGV